MRYLRPLHPPSFQYYVIKIHILKLCEFEAGEDKKLLAMQDPEPVYMFLLVWKTQLATIIQFAMGWSTCVLVQNIVVYVTVSLRNGEVVKHWTICRENLIQATPSHPVCKFLFNIILPKSKGLRSSPYSLVYLFQLILTLRNTFPLSCCRSVATFTQTDTTQASSCLATRCHCAVAVCVALPSKTIYDKIDVM